MYVYICMPACVCAHNALFLYCVWCSTDSEQQGWRESLLTGSDSKLWNGNKGSCHYSTNSLSCTHRCTARQQWLQTNKQTASPSSPLLACWTQIVMRDMRGEQRIVLNTYKNWSHKSWGLCGAMGKNLSLKSFFCFVLFCFPEVNSTNQLPSVQYTVYYVHIDKTINNH